MQNDKATLFCFDSSSEANWQVIPIVLHISYFLITFEHDHGMPIMYLISDSRDGRKVQATLYGPIRDFGRF